MNIILLLLVFSISLRAMEQNTSTDKSCDPERNVQFIREVNLDQNKPIILTVQKESPRQTKKDEENTVNLLEQLKIETISESKNKFDPNQPVDRIVQSPIQSRRNSTKQEIVQEVISTITSDNQSAYEKQTLLFDTATAQYLDAMKTLLVAVTPVTVITTPDEQQKIYSRLKSIKSILQVMKKSENSHNADESVRLETITKTYLKTTKPSKKTKLLSFMKK